MESPAPGRRANQDGRHTVRTRAHLPEDHAVTQHWAMREPSTPLMMERAVVVRRRYFGVWSWLFAADAI